VPRDRSASRRAGFVAGTAVLGRRRLDVRLTAELRQARLTQQQAHRASFGAFPEKGALRPTQDLDSVDIEEPRADFSKVALQAVERSIVDEDAGRRASTGVVAPPNR